MMLIDKSEFAFTCKDVDICTHMNKGTFRCWVAMPM